MTRSRSPKLVLHVAYLVAAQALPKYSHRYSPKKFTQHQLFACLVLKDFYGLSFRAVAALLEDCSDLREVIELEVVPHFTALQKAAQRLLVVRSFRKLLAITVKQAQSHRMLRCRVRLAAIDTAGSSRNTPAATSPSGVKRRESKGESGKSCTGDFPSWELSATPPAISSCLLDRAKVPTRTSETSSPCSVTHSAWPDRRRWLPTPVSTAKRPTGWLVKNSGFNPSFLPSMADQPTKNLSGVTAGR